MRLFLGFVLALVLFAAAPAFAESPNEVAVGTIEGRIVEGTTLEGVEGATVVLTDTERGPVVASGTTTADGWFRYKVPPGTYDVLAIFGDARWIHLKTKVERNKVVQVAGALHLDAEMVTVHDKAAKTEHRAPEVVGATVKPIMPYSDEAIDTNVWAVSWMLLDVDDKGIVTSFRFLRRAGYGLDPIAEKEIWSLRFKPAIDANGQPMVSKVLWKLEWPSFFWAKEHKLVGTGAEGALTPSIHEIGLRDKIADQQFQGGELYRNPTSLEGGTFVLPDGVHKPPCKGSGPLHLDTDQPVYRDCTPPDLGNVNREPVVVRPSE